MNHALPHRFTNAVFLEQSEVNRHFLLLAEVFGPEELDTHVADLRALRGPTGGYVFIFGLPSVLSSLHSMQEWSQYDRLQMRLGMLSDFIVRLTAKCPPEAHIRLFSCAMRVLASHSELSSCRPREAVSTVVEFLSSFE